jgi:hypothetical protein
MQSLYYSTGQIGRQLGTSQDAIRAMCQSGAIQAEITPGGQWRVSAAEVERLRREGLPTVPRPLPGESGPRTKNGRGSHGHPALLAAPSDDVIGAAESVVVLENEVKALELRQRKEERLDWFRQRAREQAEERDAEDSEKRARAAEEQYERQHEAWLQHWESHGLACLPYDAPPEVRIETHEAVRRRLESLRPTPADDVTRGLVEADVQIILNRWRREQEIEAVLIEARDRLLPYEARGSYGELTDWQVRAVRAVAGAIGELRDDATIEEMRAAAKHAVARIETDFQAHKAAQADAEQRQRIILLAPVPHELNDHGRELAHKAIADALAKLPLGTSHDKLLAARGEALAPFRAIVDAWQANQQEQNRRQQEHQIREAIITATPLWLPWDLPSDLREQALAAVRKAVEQAPEGTPGQGLEQVRDQVLQMFLKTHSQRKRKVELIVNGLREIFTYVLSLERDWDFEGKTASTLESEIKDAIRKRLEADLTGTEPLDQVTKRVRRLVREELDIAPRHSAA